MTILRVQSEPILKAPALLCAFGGWADAASAATGALRYLLLKREGTRLADFDPDAIYNYTATRPITLLDEHGRRSLKWPELAWTAIEVPDAPRDLVILLGPEPDLRWKECVRTIGEFASRLGVSRLLAFGAFLAQVHYAAPPVVTGVAFDPALRLRMLQLGVEQTNYQGPTSFVTAVLREASDRGIPAASLWVAAPSYLSNTSNPKLAAALLRVTERLLGQDLWLAELDTAGRDMERRIEEALHARPDLVNFLRGLSGETASPEVVEPEPPAEEPQSAGPEPPLPSAEEVLKDLEEHLRRLREDPDRPNEG